MTDKTLNPYAEMGEFELFNFEGISPMIHESLKKTLYGGIDARKKTHNEDLNEAIYSLGRAIEEHLKTNSRYIGKAAFYSANYCEECLDAHKQKINTPDKQIEAARNIMLFMRKSKVIYLERAVVCLEGALSGNIIE